MATCWVPIGGLLLSILACGAAIGNFDQRQQWLLLIGLSATAAAAVLIYVGRAVGRVGLWHPAFAGSAFIILTYVARPAELWSGQAHSRWQSSDALRASSFQVQGVVAIFLIVLATTVIVAHRRRLALPLAVDDVVGGRLIRVGLASFLMAVLALLALTDGNPVGAVASASTRRANLAGGFYLVAFLQLLPAVLYFAAGKAARQRLGSRSLLILAALVACLMLLPLGGRSEFLRLGLGMLASWQVAGGRVGFKSASAALCIGALVIVVGLDLRLRTNESQAQSSTVDAGFNNVASSVLDAGFTGYDRMSFALPRIPSEIPFQGWTTFGRAVLAPIPRVLWPEKPGLSEATITARVFGTDVGRYPIGVIGEGWLQAGLVGVGVQAVMLGAVWSYAGRRIAAIASLRWRIVAVQVGLALAGGINNVALAQGALRVAPVVAIAVALGARSLYQGESSGEEVRLEA